MTSTSSSISTYTYAIINNIPKDYHAADLRDFFSQLVESSGFKCFHYRHRPEVKARSGDVDNNPDSRASNSRCCVVVVSRDNMKKSLELYHRKHWLDSRGELMTQSCFIAEIKLSDDGSTEAESVTGPSGDTLSQTELNKLAELHPPAVMRNGNVGTPSSVFRQLIRDCRLPASVIGKLRITFPKTKPIGRFSTVPHVYEETKTLGRGVNLGADSESLGAGLKVGSRTTRPYSAREPEPDPEPKTENDEQGSDSDSGEEWERHQALHADEFERSRTKERVYEEPIELKWEKGGSGLVFYTDSYRWKQDEGDFDEQTADDWDVDMSAYYDPDPDAGDKDARDFLAMRASERRRRGEMDDQDNIFSGKIGKFEMHTRGFGRKLMERQGWKEGSGLGTAQAGMKDALENEGQPPRVKTGFGYRGEKLNRYPVREPRQDILISTVYDKPQQLMTSETLLRRHGEQVTNMTYLTDKYGMTSSRRTDRTEFVESRDKT